MAREWIIWGISELSGWFGHRNPTAGSPTGRDAQDCLDAHRACGTEHVVWDLGRSVLHYHSDLAGASCRGFAEAADGGSKRQAMLDRCYREQCQLRTALRYANSEGFTLYGRLCMNRHYAPGGRNRGRFAEEHPQWCETAKDGWMDPSRMCYGVAEYRRERVAILMEAAHIGVHGLQVDFCRQPPMVRYHPSLVNGYREAYGEDPRNLDLTRREAFLHWCSYRAEAVTQFLRELRSALQEYEQRWLRRVPIQVRIPNDGLEANLIAGFDLPVWCREGLIDELALTELRWMAEYQEWADTPYLALGREYGLPVYGASNCLPVQRGGFSGELNPRGVNPLVLAQKALACWDAGAQGISLYQSDTGIQRPGLQEAITAMGRQETLREYVEDPRVAAAYPLTPDNQDYGIDNHSPAPENYWSAASGSGPAL